MAISAGHWHNRQPALIIELRLIEAQPVAQPVARQIGKGPATVVHPHARCLPGNQDPRLWRKPGHRSRLMRTLRRGKAVCTDPAGPDFIAQCHANSGLTAFPVSSKAAFCCTWFCAPGLLHLASFAAPATWQSRPPLFPVQKQLQRTPCNRFHL